MGIAVGIDLGTTHTVLSYVDTEEPPGDGELPPVRVLDVPQAVAAAQQVEPRPAPDLDPAEADVPPPARAQPVGLLHRAAGGDREGPMPNVLRATLGRDGGADATVGSAGTP